MLKAVRGSYHDGIVELNEQPADVSEAQVIVTFLDIVPSDNKPILPRQDTTGVTRLKGLLAGRVSIPPDTDSVRKALEQLRKERAVALENSIEDLLNGQGGS
jgi:hypothetical protein